LRGVVCHRNVMQVPSGAIQIGISMINKRLGERLKYLPVTRVLREGQQTGVVANMFFIVTPWLTIYLY